MKKKIIKRVTGILLIIGLITLNIVRTDEIQEIEVLVMALFGYFMLGWVIAKLFN